MRRRTLSTLLAMLSLMACGGPPPSAGPARARRSPEPGAAEHEAPAIDSPSIAEAPPAPGTSLAGGRIGSLLAELSPGEWRLRGRFGRADEGPDVPSHHVLRRTTDAGSYDLHVIAWDAFVPVGEGEDLAALATRDLDAEGTTLAEREGELSVVGTTEVRPGWGRPPETDVEEVMGARLLAQLSVAIEGSTVVGLALACEESEACAADDHGAVATELARSLRRGPASRGGGEWTFSLPRGAADREITVSLPEGVLGLAPRPRHDGVIEIPAVDLATGAVAMKVTVDPHARRRPAWVLEPGAGGEAPEPLPTSAGLACAPFDCSLELPERSAHRASLARALSSAEVTEVPAAPARVPLAGGRLFLRATGPWMEESNGVERDLGAPVETHARIDGARLHVIGRDTLRAVEDFDDAASALAGPDGVVERLESGDPALTIARIESGRDRAYWQLLVAEQDGTGIVIELPCERGAPCERERGRVAETIARRLERGTPLATTREWTVRIAGRVIAMELPEGYVTSEWFDDNHGGWGATAHHVRSPAATLEIEDSGAAPQASIDNVGERGSRRATLRLGGERFAMREYRRHDGSSVWGADLGCGGSACVILVRTDDLGERDRLLEVLARARVTRLPPCPRGYVSDHEPLNVREGPGTRARVLTTIDPDEEVTVAETRGRWSRLSAPVEGWVWDAHVQRACE